MKTVKLYVSLAGNVSLCKGDPAIGRDPAGRGNTFAIRDVPSAVTDGRVLQMFNMTVVVAPEARGYVCYYHELGPGRILAA